MIIVFIIYLCATLAIGYISARRAKTASDFVLGDKKIGGVSLALSERATGESAWLLLGLTGEAYAIGLQSIWVAFGCIFGIIFIWYVMGNRLRIETERTGALTVSGLLTKKYPGSEKFIGTLSTSIIVFFFLFYIAAQFNGGGKILFDTFGLDPVWGIIIGSFVVIFYCVIGGFLSVVATDVFQAILMIITLIFLPVILIFIAAFNNIEIFNALTTAGDNYMSVTGKETGLSAIMLILSGLSWALGYTGQPQLLTRMMAVKDEKDIKVARKVAIIWTLFAYAGALIIGFIGFAFVKNGFLGSEEAKLAKDCEKILSVMINTFVTPIIAGILLSGVISAMMSTASSELVVSSSSISEDVYLNYTENKPSPKKLLSINKLFTLIVGTLAFILAMTVDERVYGLVSYAWSGIGSSFGPALLLILFWKRFSRAGIIASLFSGTIVTILWKIWILPPTGISERLGSFVISFLLAIVFALIFPEKSNQKS